MPGYIGFRPQFNPISLQEYLTVPMMIEEGRQKEADKLESYKNEADKIRYLMGDSDRAKTIWAEYDNILNGLADDIMSNKAGDIARINRKLLDTYRGIRNRAERASARIEKYQDLVKKNPDLIGNIGEFMDYYDNPDYTPRLMDGKNLSKGAETLTKQVALGMGYRPTGQYKGNPSDGQAVYIQGMTPMEIQNAFNNATTGTPKTDYELLLAKQLNDYGYYNADAATKRQIEDHLLKGMNEGNPFKTDILDKLKIQNQRLGIQQKRQYIANNRGGGSGKKSKYKYSGVVSAKPSEEIEDDLQVVKYPSITIFGTDYTIGENGKKVYRKGKRMTTRDENIQSTELPPATRRREITQEEARQNYKSQYFDLFSSTGASNYEAEGNAKDYRFFTDNDGILYIVSPDAQITDDVSSVVNNSNNNNANLGL